MAMLGGGFGPQVMRSLRRDSSVTKERLSPGIVRRIARYARPYRWQIAAFLAVVVLDAIVVIANPLLLKAIIDQGIIAGRAGVVIGLSAAVAGLAVVDAALGIADLSCPDYGAPVPMAAGEVPVFWACGVTPQAAAEAARLEFMITHAPGHMFITDLRDEELADG